MNDMNKEYLMEVRESNLEEMKNRQDMIVCRLESILADVQRSLHEAKTGNFNSIDTMCGNVSSELIRIMRDTYTIKELRTQNSTIDIWMKG